MHEWLSSQPVTWPELRPAAQAPSNDLGGDQALLAQSTGAVAEVIAVAGDTRRLTHVSAGLLAGVLIGAAAVSATLASRDKALGLGSVALLVPVIVTWLATGLLLLLSEGPVTSALGELRRVTGAPVDPSAPWRPLGLESLADAEVTWDYVVPLIAAATRRHARARFALGAAFMTTAMFLLWMVLSLAAAAVA
jgi:hypothetical protein